VAVGDKLRPPLTHILMGIDGLRTHIAIVSISLSLGTLWNGLGFPAHAEAVSLPSGNHTEMGVQWVNEGSPARRRLISEL
jgi:hypothetical protein